MAYTIGVEHAKRMTVDGKPVEVQLRATNIFRLQGGKWKLVHHHADLSAPLEAAVSSK
jgi:ketosteroid isomerase-like protein